MSENVFIAQGAIVLGNVEIGDNVGIWFNAVIRSEKNLIKIGSNSNVQDNCVLHVDPWTSIEIGEYVTIGHGAIVHGCRIGNNCLIGMGAIVMNGAVIGDNCIIGAGAVVTENTIIPDNSLVIGTPGKVKREVSIEDAANIRKNAEHYVHMAAEYLKKQ